MKCIQKSNATADSPIRQYAEPSGDCAEGGIADPEHTETFLWHVVNGL
jgi:hypothetical protein